MYSYQAGYKIALTEILDGWPPINTENEQDDVYVRFTIRYDTAAIIHSFFK